MKSHLLISALVLSGATFAQSTFQWDTNDSVVVNLNQNTYDQYPLYQSVVGNDTVTLAIEIIYNDLPQSWDGMVCVYGLCMGSIPPVGTTTQMSPISGSNQGMIRLTVNPFNGTEAAKLQVMVWDIDHPTETDTATFLLNTTLNTNELEPSRVVIAPNPVQNELSIDSEYQLNEAQIMDAAGRVMKVVEITAAQQSINVSDLTDGVYTLRLAGNEGIVEKRFMKL